MPMTVLVVYYTIRGTATIQSNAIFNLFSFKISNFNVWIPASIEYLNNKVFIPIVAFNCKIGQFRVKIETWLETAFSATAHTWRTAAKCSCRSSFVQDKC